MQERSIAHRWIDLAARVLSSVAVPIVVYLFFGRMFFACAAVPLMLLLPGGWGLAALFAAVAAGLLQTIAGLSCYPVLPAALMAAEVVGLATGRLAGVDPRVPERVADRVTPWAGVAAGVFLLLVLVRGVFWLDTLALSAGYGSVFAAWARASGKPIGRLVAKGLARAGLVAILVLVTVFLAELMARRVYGTPRRVDIGNFQWHPTRVYTLTPGFTGEITFNDGNTVRRMPFSYSSQGLRDVEIGPKQPGEFRIVMLGDSYTAGMTMRLEQTIPKQVEAKLRERLPRLVTVINAGIPGYGPWQERGFLNEVAFPLEPDLVIHQILPSNDIDNTLCGIGKHPEVYYAKWWSGFDYLRRRREWPMQADRRLREVSQIYALVSDATRRRYLIEALNRIRFVPRLDLPKPAPPATRDPLIEVNLRDWCPIFKEGWAMMQDDMRGIRDDCRKRGIGLMIYSVPVQLAVRDAWWQTATEGKDIYERDKDTRIIREFCRRENIPFIEILPALRNHPDIGSLYFSPDGHFTPAGAEVVAAAIVDRLCADYFSDCKE